MHIQFLVLDDDSSQFLYAGKRSVPEAGDHAQ